MLANTSSHPYFGSFVDKQTHVDEIFFAGFGKIHSGITGKRDAANGIIRNFDQAQISGDTYELALRPLPHGFGGCK